MASDLRHPVVLSWAPWWTPTPLFRLRSQVGNPYATHYYQPDEPESPAGQARKQFRGGENPYAFHYYFETDAHETSTCPSPTESAGQLSIRKSLSKADFESGCRSIFRRYMPEMERTKLRPHHQEFIRRNMNCSPGRRFGLLEALRRYDLSSERGLRTYFNREEDAFTEAKLLKIEESVKDE